MTRLSLARWLLLAVVLVATGCASADDDAESILSAAGEPIGDAEPVSDPEAVADVLDVGAEDVTMVDLPTTDLGAFVLYVDGEDALDVWAEARRALSETGRYPVIAGGENDFGYDPVQKVLDAVEFLDVEDGYSTEDALAEAEELSVETWFTQRPDSLDLRPDELVAERPPPDHQWPKDQFSSHRDVMIDEPLDSVAVVLMPTSRSWEVPAYFLWGGWSHNPWPHEHVMLLRHWSETYGADVVVMSADVIEMTVAEPPKDDDEAIALAREHFLYAPDIVWQGTSDLASLASAIQNAPVWFFWWD